ncbi:hypothetical protein Gorai_006418, partial [Gossypium raimondii]|nr:hypothetical protein [Gossypium raimondii]
MRSMFANLWYPLGGVSISDIREKRYLFRFYYEIDLKRIYNLPMGFMSKGMAYQFGNFIDTLMEYDTTSISKGIDRFLRIRYEKLKLFCFLCGKLGHWEGFCSMWVTFGWDILLKGMVERVFGGTKLDMSMELGSNMEDNLLEVVDGKKRQRTHTGNLNGHVNVSST